MKIDQKTQHPLRNISMYQNELHFDNEFVSIGIILDICTNKKT